VKTFGLLVSLRVREVLSTFRVAVNYLGLPVLMVILTGAMFHDGQPFERRTVLLVGEGSFPEELTRLQDLRLRRAPDREVALSRLRARAVQAVVVFDAGRPAVHVGPRDELLGQGLLRFIPAARLTVEPVPATAYLHYLFPGLLVWSIVNIGLITVSYRMVRYRRTQFLKKLGFTPLPRAVFVGSQIASLSIVVLIQMALMVLTAVVLFDLPLTVGGAGWLLLLTFLGLLVFVGAGFALASFVRDEGVMQDVAAAVSVGVILLSEIFFPAEDLSSGVSGLSAALPSTQLVRLLRATLLYGEHDLGALLPSLAIIVAWMLGTFALALLAFRWSE
jgi:ABC-type multidrug transport system permease subunit